MISGQAPNPDTQSDCNAGFKDVFPGVMAPDGQVVGAGCVYPKEALTIADQLDAKGLSWKGYMEDMGADPTREPADLCASGRQRPGRHPDRLGDRPVRHAPQPLRLLHSIIDDQKALRRARRQPQRAAGDLASAATTPNLVFVTPDLCSDGHDTGCADGRPGGLTSVDVFLREWVPRSRARRPMPTAGCSSSRGMRAAARARARRAPAAASKNGPTRRARASPARGGQTGAVVLSPFTAPGSVNDTPYNHYALLRSLEDLFGLGHLGYAGQSGLKASAATCSARRPPST